MKLNVTINGRPVREYSHNGATYIEGRKGSSYSIKLHNSHYQRVKAVVSVDGLNVISGEPCTGDKEDRGYLIPAFGSYEVKGFRANLNEVGAFTFAAKEGSYADSKGEGGNCGVIGVRFYEEKEQPAPKIEHIHHHHYNKWYPWKVYPYKVYPEIQPWNDYPWHYYGDMTYKGSSGEPTTYTYSCNAGGSMMRSAANMVQSEPLSPQEEDFSLGTSWGEKKIDNVTEVEFEAGRLICEQLIYYSSKVGLEQMGIKLVPEKNITAKPQAFRGFCTPPPGWKQ